MTKLSEFDELVAQLTRSEAEFAESYLKARGWASTPGKFLSVDDARANAVLDLVKRNVPLPEVMRWKLHNFLEVVRAVEAS